MDKFGTNAKIEDYVVVNYPCGSQFNEFVMDHIRNGYALIDGVRVSYDPIMKDRYCHQTVVKYDTKTNNK